MKPLSTTCRKLLALAILVILGLMLAGCASPAKDMPFETVSQYPISYYEQNEPGLVIVADRTGVQSLPALMADNPDVDQVLRETDFSTRFLLVAFQGVQMSGGHGIEVIALQQSGRRVEVTARFTESEGGATLGVTSPYHMVRVKKQELDGDRFTFVLIDAATGEAVARAEYSIP